MNWLDIVILVILAVAVFTGLKNGLIKMVLSAAGLIIGIMLAGRFHVALGEKLAFISNEKVAEAVAFILILIVVSLIASILANILTGIVSLVMLGWVNRLGGAALGFIVGAIFCAALLAIWVKFPGSAGTVRGSAFANILLDRFPAVLAFLPEEFDAVRAFFQ